VAEADHCLVAGSSTALVLPIEPIKRKQTDSANNKAKENSRLSRLFFIPVHFFAFDLLFIL